MAQNVAAYDFSLFEPYNYGSAAPVIEPEYIPDEPDRVRKKSVKKNNSHGISNADKKATYASIISSAKVISCIFVIFSVISLAIYLNVKLDETARQISSVESDIEISKSENVRLLSTLEGMVSIDKIEDYAENNLGMVKLENYKITYFESEEGNHVVVSGGKSYSDTQAGSKLKNLTEYILSK